LVEKKETRLQAVLENFTELARVARWYVFKTKIPIWVNLKMP
jgi:hypothetical protein